MEKKRVFMIIQSLLCVLSAIMLMSAAIGIYSEGKQRKAEDPTAYIYTREAAVKAAAPGAVVLLLGLCLSIVGWAMDIHDESADKPVMIPEFAGSMKEQLKEGAAGEERNDPSKKNRLKRIRLAVLIVAVICIIAGIANHNMRDILIKATNICTECIGLG
jgi:hypothetical protein